MKKLLLIPLLLLALSCSKEDPEVNYLISVERAKEGIIGTWKTVGQGHTLTFTADSIYYNNGDSINKDTWDISSSGSSYIYFVSSIFYSPCKIDELTNKKLSFIERINGQYVVYNLIK